ncbi:MAG: ATPase, T2SS/T4P/T4SS family, partial [Bacilli bacterium]
MIDVASYVDQIIDEAIRLRASDIHIEPMGNNFYVRLRVDGILQPHDEQNLSYFSPVISRIKVLSGLDIGERRLPQDGSLLHKKSQDIRISTLPTIYGEKMVLRLLRQEESLSRVSQLGLESVSQVQFMKMIQKPHGMVLVTGPTGSGKTTTLYA